VNNDIIMAPMMSAECSLRIDFFANNPFILAEKWLFSKGFVFAVLTMD